MATPLLKLELQSNRNVLLITDVSTDVWGTAGYNLADFVAGNPTNSTVVLSVSYRTLNSSNSVVIELIKEGAFGVLANAVTKDKLTFMLAIDKAGVMKYISNLTNLPADNQKIPDGIYTISYKIDNKVTVIEYTSTNVIKEGADQVVIKKAEALSNKFLICNTTNLQDISDDLVYEAMLFCVTKASIVSKTDAILKLLTLINNEDYEYYTN